MKVKVPVKRRDRVTRPRELAQSTVWGNKWTKSVRSWIIEFQKCDRGEALPAFDSLFKGAGRIRGASIDTDNAKEER